MTENWPFFSCLELIITQADIVLLMEMLFLGSVLILILTNLPCERLLSVSYEGHQNSWDSRGENLDPGPEGPERKLDHSELLSRESEK